MARPETYKLDIPFNPAAPNAALQHGESFPAYGLENKWVQLYGTFSAKLIVSASLLEDPGSVDNGWFVVAESLTFGAIEVPMIVRWVKVSIEDYASGAPAAVVSGYLTRL